MHFSFTLHWPDILYPLATVGLLMLRSWLTGKAVTVAEKLVLRIEHILVRTEREAIEWVHYRSKATRDGHRYKRTRQCQDGKCIEVRR